MRFVYVVLAAVSLVGCAGGLEVVSASSDAVTIRASPDRDTDSAANSECDKFGKKARQRSRHTESTNQNFVIYDCVAR
jgi:hypothetical protein